MIAFLTNPYLLRHLTQNVTVTRADSDANLPDLISVPLVVSMVTGAVTMVTECGITWLVG